MSTPYNATCCDRSDRSDRMRFASMYAGVQSIVQWSTIEAGEALENGGDEFNRAEEACG